MRETITICGLQMSARQQQHFGFPHSKYLQSFQTNSGSRLREKRKSMAKIRTEVFIETSEIVIIKRNRTFIRTWCDECGRDIGMVTLSEAALLSGHDAKAIRSMMENQHIHFRYLKTDTPYICLKSLCLF
jgi:hypothetical protein